MPVEKIFDEEGGQMSGIILRDTGNSHPNWTITVFHTVNDSVLNDVHHDRTRQLRQGQGNDVYEQLAEKKEAQSSHLPLPQEHEGTIN